MPIIKVDISKNVVFEEAENFSKNNPKFNEEFCENFINISKKLKIEDESGEIVKKFLVRSLLMMNYKDFVPVDFSLILNFLNEIRELKEVGNFALLKNIEAFIKHVVKNYLLEDKKDEVDFFNFIIILDQIGFSELDADLKEYTESFLKSDEYKKLLIQKKVNFLLHCKNLKICNQIDFKEYVKEIVQYVNANSEYLSFSGNVANAAIDLISYCDLVLDVKIEDVEFVLKALELKRGNIKISDSSSFHKKVFDGLKNRFNSDKSEEDWIHVADMDRKNNSFFVHGFSVENEYLISYKGTALRRCDIAVLDAKGNLVMIIEVDGPSHFGLLKVKNGKTVARDNLYKKLSKQVFFVDFDVDFDKCVDSIFKEIKSIVNDEIDNSASLNHKPELILSEINIEKEEQGKSFNNKSLVIKQKSKAEIQKDLIEKFLDLIVKSPKKILDEIEYYLDFDDEFLKKLNELRIDELNVFDFFLQKFESSSDKRESDELAQIINLIFIYGLEGENKVDSKKVLNHHILGNVFTRSKSINSKSNKNSKINLRNINLAFKSILDANFVYNQLKDASVISIQNSVYFKNILKKVIEFGLRKDHPLFEYCAKRGSFMQDYYLDKFTLGNFDDIDNFISLFEGKKDLAYLNKISALKNEGPRNLFFIVISHDRLDILQKLFDKLNDFNVIFDKNKDFFARSILSFAFYSRSEKCAEFIIQKIKEKGKIKEFLQSAFSGNDLDRWSESLSYASFEGNLPIVKMIFEVMRDVKSSKDCISRILYGKNNRKHSVLIYASAKDNLTCFEFILTELKNLGFSASELADLIFDPVVNKYSDSRGSNSKKPAIITKKSLSSFILTDAIRRNNIQVIEVVSEIFKSFKLESKELKDIFVKILNINSEIKEIWSRVFYMAYCCKNKDALCAIYKMLKESGLNKEDLSSILNQVFCSKEIDFVVASQGLESKDVLLKETFDIFKDAGFSKDYLKKMYVDLLLNVNRNNLNGTLRSVIYNFGGKGKFSEQFLQESLEVFEELNFNEDDIKKLGLDNIMIFSQIFVFTNECAQFSRFLLILIDVAKDASSFIEKINTVFYNIIDLVKCEFFPIIFKSLQDFACVKEVNLKKDILFKFMNLGIEEKNKWSFFHRIAMKGNINDTVLLFDSLFSAINNLNLSDDDLKDVIINIISKKPNDKSNTFLMNFIKGKPQVVKVFLKELMYVIDKCENSKDEFMKIFESKDKKGISFFQNCLNSDDSDLARIILLKVKDLNLKKDQLLNLFVDGYLNSAHKDCLDKNGVDVFLDSLLDDKDKEVQPPQAVEVGEAKKIEDKPVFERLQ
jgi:hypothetical protein